MKYTIFLISLSFLFLNSFAQDKKADEILERVKQKTESYSAIKAHFTYSMINDSEGINESFEGMLVLKGDMYRLKVSGQEVICDGKTMWTYIPDAEEVQINDVEEDEESITPTKLFSDYYEDFKTKFLNEETVDGKTLLYVSLTPKEDQSFSNVVIAIIKEDDQISSVSMFDKNGNEYIYKVKDFIGDYAIEDSYFSFDETLHPDVDIIDMR